MHRSITSRLFFSTLLALSTLVTVARAAPASSNTLADLLERKYGNNSGFNKAFNSIFPQRGPATTPVPHEGRKADGNYWWGAYFRNGNVVVLSWPHKML